MDRLAWMQAYVKVVDEGSFARASSALGLTPAMVGRQIRSLEDHLGAQLLRRTTRRQSQTEAGRIFYERAMAVLAEFDAAEQSVAELRAVVRIPIHLDSQSAGTWTRVRHLDAVGA